MYKTKAFLTDYIWGGERLRAQFGKTHGEKPVVAESWELSTHPTGSCGLLDTPYGDLPLPLYVDKEGAEVLGARCCGEMPLLVKLIDARDDLSIQVHPGDDFARLHENDRGKTEMWYVIDCEPGARLVYGLKRNTGPEELARHIHENTLQAVLNIVDVRPGDVFFIPAGMIHAIGKGIVIAEVQESSNVTYRLYDYGRPGADGKPRALHLEKALQVADLSAAPVKLPRYSLKEGDAYASAVLAQCQYFTTTLYRVKTDVLLEAGPESFHVLLVTAGACTVRQGGRSLSCAAGDCLFICAGSGRYTVSGGCDLLQIFVS